MDAAVSVTTVRKKHRRIGAGTVVIYLVLIFWAVLTIFPFVWVVLNSFKPSAEVLRSSFSLPETFTWMNYQTAFERLNVLRAYRYSFVISGTVTVGVMVFASLMAFGLTRYHFKGKELIRSLIVASLMFPVFSTIIPVFKMMVEWGLLNKSIAVILPQIAGNLSFASEERLEKYLGLKQGSVSPFGLMNDTDHAVEFFIDKNLSKCKSLGIHPLENTATVFLSFKDLDKFLWNLDVDVMKIRL